MSTVRVEVRAKGGADFFFAQAGEHTPVVPRVRERVEFPDGIGVVESVTWKLVAPRHGTTRRGSARDMLIVVECVPVATP